MGLFWASKQQEVEQLRRENQRLQRQVLELKGRLGNQASDIDPYGVSTEEREAVSAGKKIQAIKMYRERTGADLLTAKNAIDSLSE